MFGRSALCLVGSLWVLIGCGPKYTYLAADVPASIEKICQKEYKLDVSARVVGKTVGALLTMDSILDESGQVSKEVHEQMGKVMMAVTRVGLSTDLPVDFCVVVIRDHIHPLELVITRSLDDSKRANADVIGVEESIQRTLFGQAKIELDPDAPFVLKEVRMENFLTEQIIQRARAGLARELRSLKDQTAKPDDASEAVDQPLILIDGDFDQKEGHRFFQFQVISLKREGPRQIATAVFKIINQVLAAYRFEAFDAIEIQDYVNSQKLVLDRQTLLDYQKKKISLDQILDNFLMESKVAEDAFKLFGFNKLLAQEGEELPLPDEEELALGF